MKLEITLSKGTLRKKFDRNDKYNRLRERIDRHKVVISDELFFIWEKDVRENGCDNLFMDWYFSLINSSNRIVKVDIKKLKRARGARSEEDNALLKTGMMSKDKIVVGNVNSDMIARNKKIAFINDKNFMREKYQTIDTDDIENVILNKNKDMIFDIYETPVRLVVKLDSSSEVLAKYLSKFMRGTNKLIVKDKFITQPENEYNIDNYILKYISKNTKLIFLFPEMRKNGKIIQKFENYKGYNSTVKFVDSKQMHHSSIETDRYIIDIGYRLRLFGGEGDGKTEEEVITITKKQIRR